MQPYLILFTLHEPYLLYKSHVIDNLFCCCAEKKGEIDKLAEEYIANVKNLASEQRVEHLQKIQNAYSKCKEFSDDKVQLAMQTYEMVSLVIWSFSTVFPVTVIWFWSHFELNQSLYNTIGQENMEIFWKQMIEQVVSHSPNAPMFLAACIVNSFQQH